MRALIYHGPGRRAWEDKPKPTLRSTTDAIIKVTKTTIFGSDLSIINGDVVNVPNGLTLGHEGIGIVEEVGSEISTFKVGDKAMISYAPPCGVCGPCRRGLYSTCENGGWILGREIDGTYAEYARIPDADSSLHHIPEGVDEGTLMMLKEILPTRFEYCFPDVHLQSSDLVVILGSGHIGLTAMLMAQVHSNAQIVMVDTSIHCLEAAVALGATRLVHTSEGDALNDLQRLTGGRRPNVVIVANVTVALRSIWRSYGQSPVPLPRVMLMPSRRNSQADQLAAMLKEY